MDSKFSHKQRGTHVDAYLNQKARSSFDKRSHELDLLKRKMKHLKASYGLQNRTVRHFMHNIMSPLSAASGYLELLGNNLEKTPDSEKLQRYTNNISDGLNEIGFLLEQLHEIFKTDQIPGEEADNPTVELNWLVNEVKEILSNSSEIRADAIELKRSEKPIYVKAELFQLKLMLYNLITTADTFSSAESKLEIEVTSDESEFALLIKNSGDCPMDESIKSVFKNRDIVRLTDEMEENSTILLGLKICAQIADQIDGNIIMDKRDRQTPQFVLTAPHIITE